jgi:transcriptional regulator with XRE-family HTH domain
MAFQEEIRKIRTENGLTQDQMAERLHVTRQAVSNWENGRNLPDIEQLIAVARTFHVSLDRLILPEGGETMENNEMTKKLIQDGSDTQRARYSRSGAWAGAVLMIMGLMCLFIKANSVEYIDEQGILHENFYLLPVGFLFMASGLLVLVVMLIRGRRRK